jgi:lipopolysaccharide/colanic/teichoic acid biosynthesis glycosyltransferase
MKKVYVLKRPFDIILSSLGLIFSIPLWLIISLAIWLEDRVLIFYMQPRVGKGGHIFNAFKFRSMIPDSDELFGPLQAKGNDHRITRVGRVLRATAMDELPQLLNILKGDMSFVGPRALLPEEIETREHSGEIAVPLEEIPGFWKRQSVRPGLTGVAQVYAPRDIKRKQKFRFDFLYIGKVSLWLDIKLILLSSWITFKGKWEMRRKKSRHSWFNVEILDSPDTRQITKAFKKRNLIGQIILESKIITDKQLHEALERQKMNNKRIGEILITMGYISETKFKHLLTQQHLDIR